jgi:DNA-directed RNA polymerase beta' subunit
MNLHIVQSEMARAEVRTLMGVPQQILSVQCNRPIIGLVQDALMGAHLLTRQDAFVERWQMADLLTQMSHQPAGKPPHPHPPPPAILKPRQLWTGKQIFSALLPFAVNLKRRVREMQDWDPLDRDERAVIIKDGELLAGSLCKQTVGGSAGGIVHVMCKDVDAQATSNFLSDAQRVINQWLVGRGFGVGADDCVMPTAVANQVAELSERVASHMDALGRLARGLPPRRSRGEAAGAMAEAAAEAVRNPRRKRPRVLPRPPPKRAQVIDDGELEASQARFANQVVDGAGRIVHGAVSVDSNRLYAMALCGSKGNLVNLTQITGVVGQQTVEGKRHGTGIDGARPHSADVHGELARRPEELSLALGSYVRGLNPRWLFDHHAAGRESLIDSAVKVSETGYIQRRLTKSMESLQVRFDGTVRNASGDVVQFCYGGDGMDGALGEKVHMRLLAWSDAEVRAQLGWTREESARYSALRRRSAFALLLASCERGGAGCWSSLPVELGRAIVRLAADGDDDREQIAAVTRGEVRRLLAARDALRRMKISPLTGRMEEDVLVSVNVARLLEVEDRAGRKREGGDGGGGGESCVRPRQVAEDVERACAELSGLSREGGMRARGTLAMRCCLMAELTSREVVARRRLSVRTWRRLIERAIHLYHTCSVQSGEMVGPLAAQSIGEPLTQMSVAWEEPLALAWPGVGVVVEEIGRTVDAWMDAAGRDEGGGSQVAELPPGMRPSVPAVAPDGSVRWRRVLAMTRHPPRGDLVRVTTASGRTVTATVGKSFLTLRGGEVVPVDGKDLREGDVLPVNDPCPHPPADAGDGWLGRCAEVAEEVRGGLRRIAAAEACFFLSLAGVRTDFDRDGALGGFDRGAAAAAVERAREKKMSAAAAEGGEDVGGVRWDPIASIERLSGDGCEWVYDLSVETDANFSLANGLQMRDTLRMFYFVGWGAKNVAQGVPRLKEVIEARRKTKKPSATVYLVEPFRSSRAGAELALRAMQCVTLDQLVLSCGLVREDARHHGGGTGAGDDDDDDDDDGKREDERLSAAASEGGESLSVAFDRIFGEEAGESEASFARWTLRCVLDRKAAAAAGLGPADIARRVERHGAGAVRAIATHRAEGEWVLRVRFLHVPEMVARAGPTYEDALDRAIVERASSRLLERVVVQGVQGIQRAIPAETTRTCFDRATGERRTISEWCIETEGSALAALLAMPQVDKRRTRSDHMREVEQVLGVEAALTVLQSELRRVVSFDTYVNDRYFMLAADVMGRTGALLPMSRSGINREEAGFLARISFERPVDTLFEAALFSERSEVGDGAVTEPIILGQLAPIGTGSVDVLVRPQIAADDGAASVRDGEGEVSPAAVEGYDPTQPEISFPPMGRLREDAEEEEEYDPTAPWVRDHAITANRQRFAPREFASSGFASQGFASQGFLSQGFAPQGFAPHDVGMDGVASHGFAPQGFAPHGFAPHGFVPQGFVPPGSAPHGFAPQQSSSSPGFAPQSFISRDRGSPAHPPPVAPPRFAPQGCVPPVASRRPIAYPYPFAFPPSYPPPPVQPPAHAAGPAGETSAAPMAKRRLPLLPTASLERPWMPSAEWSYPAGGKVVRTSHAASATPAHLFVPPASAAPERISAAVDDLLAWVRNEPNIQVSAPVVPPVEPSPLSPPRQEELRLVPGGLGGMPTFRDPLRPPSPRLFRSGGDAG